MIERLCTTDQAKAKLSIYDSLFDTQIEDAIDMASAAVLDYCLLSNTDDLTDIQKACMRAATLNLLVDLYDGDGGTETKFSNALGELPINVTQFLIRIRPSVIA